MEIKHFKKLDIAYVDLPCLVRTLKANEQILDVGAISDLFTDFNLLKSIKEHRQKVGIEPFQAFYTDFGSFDDKTYSDWQKKGKEKELKEYVRNMLKNNGYPENWFSTFYEFTSKGIFSFMLSEKPSDDKDETIIPGFGSPKRSTYSIEYDDRSASIKIFPGFTRKQDLDDAWKELNRSDFWQTRLVTKPNKLAHLYMFFHSDCSKGRFDTKFKEKMKKDFGIESKDFGKEWYNNFDNLARNYSKTVRSEGWDQWL